QLGQVADVTQAIQEALWASGLPETDSATFASSDALNLTAVRAFDQVIRDLGRLAAARDGSRFATPEMEAEAGLAIQCSLDQLGRLSDLARGAVPAADLHRELYQWAFENANVAAIQDELRRVRQLAFAGEKPEPETEPLLAALVALLPQATRP